MPSALKDTTELRQAIIDGCRWMNAQGINQGTSGNISVRLSTSDMLITPTGIPYDAMTPDMLVTMPIMGPPVEDGGMKPSSEWRFHQALLAARPDMEAVVHAHPTYGTVLGIQRRGIPACHYMVAIFGGDDVPVADYALFGSDALSRNVVSAMTDRHGCIMSNHGAIVVGETLAKALWRMEELENLARLHVLSGMSGSPVLLSPEEMDQVMDRIVGYGQKS